MNLWDFQKYHLLGIRWTSPKYTSSAYWGMRFNEFSKISISLLFFVLLFTSSDSFFLFQAGREPPEFACLFHAWKGTFTSKLRIKYVHFQIRGDFRWKWRRKCIGHFEGNESYIHLQWTGVQPSKGLMVKNDF